MFENSHGQRLKVSAISLMCVLFAACQQASVHTLSAAPPSPPASPGASEPVASVPDVLGIRFGGTVADIKRYLPDGAKPDEYPSISLRGYTLDYPNPDNWTVLVQEEAAHEMLGDAIWLIALSRRVPNSCTRDQTADFVGKLPKKYSQQFLASYTHRMDDLSGERFVAVSPRRMLVVKVGCFVDDLFATFAYFDLDRYHYRDVTAMQKTFADELKQAEEFGSRKFE